jgi:integrase
MRGRVRKRESRKPGGKAAWEFAIDLGDAPAQRCAACGRVTWVERKAGKVCPSCMGPLGGVTLERRRKFVGGFTTKAAAQKALTEALGKHQSDEDPFPPRLTFREYVESVWFPFLQVQDAVRPNTLRTYRQMMRDHVYPVIGSLQISKLRTEHAQSVLNAMSEAGKSPRTVARVRAVMSSAVEHAVRMGRVSHNCVRSTKAPKASTPNLRIPSAEELRAIIEAARDSVWEIPVLLSATTGMRRSEVLGLRWKHVDLDGAVIEVVEALQRVGGRVITTAPKSERSTRTIALYSDVAVRLRKHRAEQAERLLALGHRVTTDDYVCDRGDGQPIEPNTYTHAASRIAEKAGASGVRLHDLRHGAITVAIKAGVPADVVSRFAGHSSVAFTLQTYTHRDAGEMAGVADALGSALGLAPDASAS